MFTTNHFIWIAICLVIIGVLLFFSLKYKFSFKTASIIMLVAQTISEVYKIFTNMITTDAGGVMDATALPFHLCSILIFAIIYIVFSKNEKAKKIITSFFVVVAFTGAPLSVLMATCGVSFADTYPYEYFIFHAVMIWYGIHLVCTKNVDLGWKSYLRNLAIILCLVMVMMWVNSILQVYSTNFFFIVRPPVEGLPILNMNHGWYAYFFTLVAVGLVLITLVHTPTMIKQYIAYKKAKKAVQVQEENN